jgi:hypothetical protein
VLERIWLAATRHGIAFQPITGITFLMLRMRLTGGERLAAQHRALLVRIEEEFRKIFPEAAAETPIVLGLAAASAGRAPRLPLEQVLEIAPRPR